MIGFTCHDRKYFKKPNKFNPNRNYEPMMTFNVLDKYFDKSKYNICMTGLLNNKSIILFDFFGIF